MSQLACAAQGLLSSMLVKIFGEGFGIFSVNMTGASPCRCRLQSRRVCLALFSSTLLAGCGPTRRLSLLVDKSLGESVQQWQMSLHLHGWPMGGEFAPTA